MIGLIYKIEQLSTGKIYIGKTYDSMESRWKKHRADCFRYPNRPLYKALINNSITDFEIVELSKFPKEILEQKESEYIELYNSYINGFNATLGGEGTLKYTKASQKILDLFKSGKSINEISRLENIDNGTLSRLFKNAGLDTSLKNYHSKVSRKVYCKELDIIFDSSLNCAKYLVENNISNVCEKSTRTSISRVANGSRKSYLGFVFSYIE